MTATAAEASITLQWSAVAGATAYEVRRGSGTVVRLRGTSHTFGGLDQWTLYTLSVRAVNAGGASRWAVVSARTGAVVSGQVAALRMAPTRTGYTLSFGFRPSGGSLIRPTLRFVRPNELSPSQWLNSSTVTRSVNGAAQNLGKVSARGAAGGRIEVTFIPAATGARVEPRNRFVRYDTMTLNRWLYSSTVTFNVASPTNPAGRSGAVRAQSDEGLAGALAPGEVVCDVC